MEIRIDHQIVSQFMTTVGVLLAIFLTTVSVVAIKLCNHFVQSRKIKQLDKVGFKYFDQIMKFIKTGSILSRTAKSKPSEPTRCNCNRNKTACGKQSSQTDKTCQTPQSGQSGQSGQSTQSSNKSNLTEITKMSAILRSVDQMRRANQVPVKTDVEKWLMQARELYQPKRQQELRQRHASAQQQHAFAQQQHGFMDCVKGSGTCPTLRSNPMYSLNRLPSQQTRTQFGQTMPTHKTQHAQTQQFGQAIPIDLNEFLQLIGNLPQSQNQQPFNFVQPTQPVQSRPVQPVSKEQQVPLKRNTVRVPATRSTETINVRVNNENTPFEVPSTGSNNVDVSFFNDLFKQYVSVPNSTESVPKQTESAKQNNSSTVPVAPVTPVTPVVPEQMRSSTPEVDLRDVFQLLSNLSNLTKQTTQQAQTQRTQTEQTQTQPVRSVVINDVDIVVNRIKSLSADVRTRFDDHKLTEKVNRLFEKMLVGQSVDTTFFDQDAFNFIPENILSDYRLTLTKYVNAVENFKAQEIANRLIDECDNVMLPVSKYSCFKSILNELDQVSYGPRENFQSVMNELKQTVPLEDYVSRPQSIQLTDSTIEKLNSSKPEEQVEHAVDQQVEHVVDQQDEKDESVCSTDSETVLVQDDDL